MEKLWKLIKQSNAVKKQTYFAQWINHTVGLAKEQYGFVANKFWNAEYYDA